MSPHPNVLFHLINTINLNSEEKEEEKEELEEELKI
jgi:hypothetical protein